MATAETIIFRIFLCILIITQLLLFGCYIREFVKTKNKHIIHSVIKMIILLSLSVYLIKFYF